ncbi:hypothetical protein ABZ935_40470 [Streptomyces coeruleorubidus]|uniref:hypothetical protein n=1 Tax=Streptomyces coeruleorubidus TaxID=116188 RepID=UPI0033D8BE54
MDIADGRPGVPLQPRITVLSAGQGVPIQGAEVDVWHCDALGYYSGHLAHDPDTLPTMNESGHVPYVQPMMPGHLQKGLTASFSMTVALS